MGEKSVIFLTIEIGVIIENLEISSLSFLGV